MGTMRCWRYSLRTSLDKEHPVMRSHFRSIESEMKDRCASLEFACDRTFFTRQQHIYSAVRCQCEQGLTGVDHADTLAHDLCDQFVCCTLCRAEMTLERGEKLENMEEKAEDLENHANLFQKNATKVKRHFLCQYIKITLLIVVILAIIGLIIGLTIWSKNK
jgi:hypothetical protein